MKLLIEIDDNDYSDIITDTERNLNYYERLIKKGVPQITGHEDCISRQAVIDMVEDMTDQFGANHRVVTEGIISMLPSVNPQEPKTDVLEKIRAEIERERSFQRAMDEYDIATGLRKALEIIDKYKTESEE